MVLRKHRQPPSASSSGSCLSFLPLTLGAGQSSGAGSGALKLPTKHAAEKILKSDNYTCRFCGFQSAQYQRVVPFEANYVTACSFCELVMSLERAGLMGSGLLIWLPEITQAELNHIARAIYVAKASEDGELVDAAARALDALTARRTDVKKRLGTDDPLVLATAFHESLTPQERKAAAHRMEGVRLLPLDKHMVRAQGRDFNGFSKIVAFWRSIEGPFAQLPTQEWKSLFAKISE